MLALLLLSAFTFAEAVTPQEPVEFERDIRPILEESCFRCHGPHAKRLRGGLMMAGRESLLQGGDSGPAITPGDPDRSLLIRMVRYESEDFEMPPTGTLDVDQVELLERWVLEGATWPGGDSGPSDRRDISMDEGRQWWAFRPVVRPEPPTLSDPTNEQSARHPIDRFVFAKLEAAGLGPAPREEERLLVRRVYIDLLGVPPTRDEVDAYLADSGPDKWTRLVDELLARDQYGERWGRYWLDVVRFAQTNGYERDQRKRYIWRYRDYVIDAFNSDKPYDQFLREQLAGDELDEVTSEGLVATGFYSLGVWDTEPNDPEQAVWDGQDDVLRTITEGMLAVTVGCARCHDHRFDPIRQRDYYSLVSFLRNVEPYENPEFSFDSKTHRLPPGEPAARDTWEAKRAQAKDQLDRSLNTIKRKRLKDYLERHFDELVAAKPELAGYTGQGERLQKIARKLGVTEKAVREEVSIQDQAESFLVSEESRGLEKSFEGDLPWIMAVSESGSIPTPTHVLRRGMASAKLEPVESRFLPVLCETDAASIPEIAPRGAGGAGDDLSPTSSGQRRALADWIADPKHPTTARVMVNRIWQGHFGRGLVGTPNDFGSQGEAPTHPLLLDWLADEFVAKGWSVKELHRQILSSATYQQSSRTLSPQAKELDPANRLLWRQNMRRLDADALRDSMLAVCGLLNDERGGIGFYPELSLEALGSASKPGAGWGKSDEKQRNRRAIYAYVKRGLLVPFLTSFDSVDPSFSHGSRPSTTVSSQALTLLNGAFANRTAHSLARELLTQTESDLDPLVRSVYSRILQREPTALEIEIGVDFLESQARLFDALPKRSTFRSSVPERVDLVYLRKLSDDEYLHAPRDAWTTYKGVWGDGYNMTLEADLARGPFALLQNPVFTDARLTFDLSFEEGCERVDLRLRARKEGETVRSINVVLDVTNQKLSFIRTAHGNQESQTLATTPFELDAETPYAFELEIVGSRLTAKVNGVQKLTFENEELDNLLRNRSGRFGVSPRGAAVHLENLVVHSSGKSHAIAPDPPLPGIERSLALFCLSVLNLNEFLYVD